MIPRGAWAWAVALAAAATAVAAVENLENTNSLCKNQVCDLVGGEAGPFYWCPKEEVLCHRRHCLYYDVCDFSDAKATVHLRAREGGFGFKTEAAFKAYLADPAAKAATAAALPHSQLRDAWAIKLPEGEPACSAVVDAPALFFNDYGFYGNYYHFTYDMLLPLYAQLRRRGLDYGLDDAAAEPVMLWPAVQKRWNQPQHWETDFFSDGKRRQFYMEAFHGLFGAAPYELRFTNISTVMDHRELCFNNATFGLPWVWDGAGAVDREMYGWDYERLADAAGGVHQRDLMLGFRRFVRRRLGLEGEAQDPSTVTVALISRQGRRKIANEVEVMTQLHGEYAAKTFTRTSCAAAAGEEEESGESGTCAAAPQEVKVRLGLVDFAAHSFRDQVQKAGTIDVMIGVNGAGLINCLYGKEDGVCTQIIPYGNDLNFDEFRYLLRQKGRYDEYKVPTEAGVVLPAEGLDSAAREERLRSPNQDTIIDVDDLRRLIDQSLDRLGVAESTPS